MSTVVKCSATTQKGTKCTYKAKYGAFCGHHCPKDGTTKKTTKTTKVSCSRSISAGSNRTLKEINLMLRAVVTKAGLNLEEVLLPVTKKYSPTYDDEDIEPEEEGEDEELLNWDKPTEVKEITAEVLVKKEREIEEEEEVPWETWVVEENEGVEMATPEIMPSCTQKEIKTKEPIVVEENKVKEPIVIKEIKIEEPTIVEEVKEEIKTKEPIVVEENKVKEPCHSHLPL